ncbi:ABC transporter permease [Catellatospora bangladeshensis]|uniref:Peptide ABC transporter permease n=1 Tax=Catellatospora bangladeshensis TaxID=310355 RepID=A0A8J3JEP2_9ACTN|nr:ABC transporter permease [Catellatospora bangladeshensis]GIF79268.1 peptide ABC transporter permease [Catellatospora bangladeshensis]
MSSPEVATATSPTEPTAVPATPAAAEVAPRKEKNRGLWSDAWYELRRKPLFVISAILITIFVLMAAFPQLFSSVDPTVQDLHKSLEKPDFGAWFKFGEQGQFGYNVLGQDIYARVIYGARASIVVGVFAVLGNMLLGGFFGIVSGYLGGWTDTLLARFGDIFLGLPFVLGALVILSTFASVQSDPSAFRITSLVILTFIVLGWPSFARIMRASVLSTKQLDYVHAAQALGARPGRIVFRHVLPNAMAPMVVVGTITLGAYIGAEATLSFLGVGLRPPVVSWGIMIGESRNFMEPAPYIMAFPAAFLVVAVLSFVMLGDAVRDALDPKLR